MWFVFFWVCFDGHEGIVSGMEAKSHGDGMVKVLNGLAVSGGHWAEIRFVPAEEC